MIEDTLSLPGLSPVDGRDIHTRFDRGSVSSDGGMRVLREIECGLKFADILAAWRSTQTLTMAQRYVQNNPTGFPQICRAGRPIENKN